MTYIYSVFLQNVQKLANLTENNTLNSNDNKIRKFFEQARTIMVCGTCKDNLAKVYQCCNGHPVCRKCLSYDMLCSICKKSIYFGKCTTLDNVADCLLQEEIFDAYERIAEILECSICYERITPPLKLCSLGHLVCESCRKRIVICPVCNNNFTVKKNKLLEKLIYLFPFHCCYYDKGCCAIENHTEIMRHEKKCQFKEYRCQVPKCKWKGRETEILNHVEETHTNVAIRSSDRVKLKFGSVSSTQPEVVWKITNLVPAYGRYFWQHFRFVNGRILFVTLITGSKEDADQFKVIIQGRFWSLPYDVFSEDADVNAFFYASNPEAYDISYMMKDKVIGTCPFGMSMESDYRIIIQRTNLGIFGLPKMWELLGITVFSSIVAILLFRLQMKR